VVKLGCFFCQAGHKALLHAIAFAGVLTFVLLFYWREGLHCLCMAQGLCMCFVCSWGVVLLNSSCVCPVVGLGVFFCQAGHKALLHAIAFAGVLTFAGVLLFCWRWSLHCLCMAQGLCMCFVCSWGVFLLNSSCVCPVVGLGVSYRQAAGHKALLHAIAFAGMVMHTLI
jgi:uncharacterized protein (DUF486 family)